MVDVLLPVCIFGDEDGKYTNWQQNTFDSPPIFKWKSCGERSFTFAAPTDWYSLPLENKNPLLML